MKLTHMGNKKLFLYSKIFLNLLNRNKSFLPKDYKNVESLALLKDYFIYLQDILRIKTNKNILDWGCGNGHISFLLKNSDPHLKVTSFSVNPKISTKMFLTNVLQLNLVTSQNKILLPFRNSSFDCIISSGVLEHVNEWGGDLDKTMNELNRILKPGGRIYILRLPFAFSIWEYFRYFSGSWYHMERYTPHQLIFFARKYNLRLVSLRLDGFLFVRLRAFIRKTNIGNKAIFLAEKFLYKFKFAHFLLNDIYCVLRK